MTRCRLPHVFAVAALLAVSIGVHASDRPASAVGAVMNLLTSGKVPPERLGPVLEIVCSRGNEHDLAYVYHRALQPDSFPPAMRVDVLHRLSNAAATRKIVPAGDLSGIAALLHDEDADLRRAAIELTGLWHVREAIAPLEALATSGQSAPAEREAALGALQRIAPDAARTAIDTLTGEPQPFAVRALGIGALVRLDPEEAARRAAHLLQQARDTDDPTGIVDAFLARQGGSEALAAALEQTPPGEDVAKLALRRMYGAGRSDAALSAVLERAAHIVGDITPPVGAELAALIADVESRGDAERGEAVFRRADLNCLKCHAVSQAGGQVGPDLSAVGSSSPMDYLVHSLFDPDAQIKEAFVTRTVLTVDGQTIQGIVADRTADRLVLKDADGRRHEIPLADIDEEIEGRSLMPKGLVKFMTRTEIVDLVKFLSELGRPGPYAIRATPRMQRWRVLKSVPAELAADVPNETTFEDRVLLSRDWEPLYARVDGMLPCEELVPHAGGPVAYVRGEFEVTRAGPVGIRVEATVPYVLWVDADSLAAADGETIVVPVEAGRHSVTLRIDATGRHEGGVRLELFRPEGSPAEFSVVDGA